MSFSSQTVTSLLELAISIAGSEAKLGALAGYSQNAIWHAKRIGRVSAQMADAIEKATKGSVLRKQLRPDIFGDDVVSVASGIRAARIGKNLAQADVADQLGVTVQAVSQWERGENYPSAVNLLKLSGILGVDLGTSDLVALTRVPPAGVAASPAIVEALQEVVALLHALDGLGARIAGDDGAAVSAVALAGKSTAEVALQALRAGEDR